MTELSEEFRPLLVAFVEALAQAERSDPLRTRLAEGYAEMRRRIVEGILAIVPDMPGDIARAVASFFIAMSDGYMVQWLLDPDATPSGEDLLVSGTPHPVNLKGRQVACAATSASHPPRASPAVSTWASMMARAADPSPCSMASSSAACSRRLAPPAPGRGRSNCPARRRTAWRR